MAAHFSILSWRIQERGAWQATVHGVTKSQTQLSNWASLPSQTEFTFSKKKKKEEEDLTFSYLPDEIIRFKLG